MKQHPTAFTIFPPMLIEEKSLRHWINHFYGYGSWHAPVWFVAYEENGGDLPEEVAEKFKYFQDVQQSETEATLCDIRQLYKRVGFRAEGRKAEVFSNLHEYRFGRDATLHGFWKNLIAFAHGYRKEETGDVLSYQQDIFASPSSAREALIRLYPLPSPHNHAWYYSWLDLSPQFGFLKSRALYEEHLYETRVTALLENIHIYQPKVVLMYGMNNINKLKKSVQEFFPDTKFKIVKAVPQQIPQYHRADVRDTTLIITTQIPGLRHNRVESGFDWQLFGKTLTSGS